MTVQSFLSIDIEPLAPSDSVGQALYRLADLDVAHLPIVDAEGHLVTIIGEDDLLDQVDHETPVSAAAGYGAVEVGVEAHWYEAASALARHHLSIVPVADAGGHYVGLVRRADLFERFAGTLSTGSTGAVLLLETSAGDFSLSQLTRLIEESGAKVLSAWTQGQEQGPSVGPMPIRATLKLNTVDTARVRHMLEHHGYSVTAVFNDTDTDEAFDLRLAEFLRYLEV